MLSLPLSVPNIEVWPLSRASSSRSRAIGGIIKVADTKDKLVKAYEAREILVGCQEENI